MSKYNDADTQEQYLERLRGIAQPDIAPEYLVRQRLSKDLFKHKVGYPRTEILEAGDICEWIANRRERLANQAEDNKQEAGVSGVMGLGVAFIGFVLSGVNPLAGIAIACGATGYGISLIANMKKFGGLKPIPFSAISLLGMIDRAGAEIREYLEEPDGYLEIVEFLPTALKAEFILLAQYEAEVTTILGRVTNGKRFQCYRFLLDFYRQNPGCLSNDMGAAAQLANKLQAFAATVNVDPTLDLEFMQKVSNFIHQAAEVAKPQQQETALSMFATMPTAGVEEPPVLQPALNINVLGTGQNYSHSNHNLQQPNLEHLISLPIQERGLKFIERVEADGLQLSRAVNKQITAICGNQRGGKGTLMGVLAILNKAIDIQSEIHYFTAGDDVYPFHCEKLLCRKTFSHLPGDLADAEVAQGLLNYLKDMDRAPNGSMENVILVIDEAVALSDYMEPEDKTWMVRFLFSRASKKGAQIFIVLHGNNLTGWVGTGNTSGLSSTFKQDTNFVGCKSKSIKKGALRSMAIATGEYFLADPSEFGKAIKGGDLGKMPDWMLKEKHPVNNAPDPVRTLLKYFPELQTSCGSPDKSTVAPQDVSISYSDPEEALLRQRVNQTRDREKLFNALESTDKNLDIFIVEDLGVPPNQSQQARAFIAQELQEGNRKDLLTKFKLS